MSKFIEKVRDHKRQAKFNNINVLGMLLKGGPKD
jgi:hypothetical protein